MEDPVVALFNYRWDGKTVRLIVEQLYAALKYSIPEKVALARSTRSNPYPAEWTHIHGVPWHGEVVCGDNPWMRARIVNNVSAEVGAAGRPTIHWDERPRPKSKRS